MKWLANLVRKKGKEKIGNSDNSPNVPGVNVQASGTGFNFDLAGMLSFINRPKSYKIIGFVIVFLMLCIAFVSGCIRMSDLKELVNVFNSNVK